MTFVTANGSLEEPGLATLADGSEPGKPKPAAKATANGQLELDILDIRRETVGISIVDEIRKGLQKEEGVEKRLPTLLLYDEAGLKLFEKITYLDEYYLTNAEISVLEQHADQIAERIADDSIVVELGSGYGPALRGRPFQLRALQM